MDIRTWECGLKTQLGLMVNNGGLCVENKHKHLEMIQGVISRMANNSFMLKGWAVTLVAGIFTLASKDADKFYFLIAYVPIMAFWGIDTYYLRQEKLYRNLYERVRMQNKEEIDFSMNVSLPEFMTSKTAYASILISTTELGFYVPLGILTAIVTIWSLWEGA